MKSFVTDLLLKKRETALKRNLMKKNIKKLIKKRMTVLSDKWIKKMLTQGNDKAFVSKQVRKGKIFSDFHLMVTMQEFLMNLRSLQMLIQE